MWCPDCYVSSEEVEFHIHTISEDDTDVDRLANIWRRNNRSARAFTHARRGDHLVTQFECDLCVFRKLRGFEPDESNHVHTLLLACIRRVNLDAFWSRASSTVISNANKMEQALRLSELVGLTGPYLPPGPLPPNDHCGYEVAVQIVLASRNGGKHSSAYTQWDTIRKIRTVYSNQVRAAAAANSVAWSIGDEDGRYTRITQDPCGSLWHNRFGQGCKKRMGQDWRPDRGMSVDLMLKLVAVIETRIGKSNNADEQGRLIIAGTYFMICYVVSLRGAEGLLLDLKGLREFWDQQPEKYTVIALLGKIKGEHHERQHLLPSVNTTSSGLEVRSWILRLITYHVSCGRFSGPAICDQKGKVLLTSDLNDLLHESLSEIFDQEPQLFLKDIQSQDDLENKYSVFRSFRRGSDSRALSMGVGADDIDVVNRWSRKERSAGSRPSHSMRHHYADINLLLESFLRYTRAM